MRSRRESTKPRSWHVSVQTLVLIIITTNYSYYKEEKKEKIHQESLASQEDFSKLTLYVSGASLVAQWLRICLLMQGTRVRALVWEDPTCRRATRPVSHNY